jgi:DNA excision repair protein ERCC-5
MANSQSGASSSTQSEEMDIDSEVFHALPTEVQYEVISEMKLRSRQTSWERLEEMMRMAPTAMDFSRLQVQGAIRRNDLTQKLLNVNNYVSKVENALPTRIASERGKEYLLVKNDEGGWILGAKKYEGTAAKPVNVDDSDDEHEEFEEVQVPM